MNQALKVCIEIPQNDNRTKQRRFTDNSLQFYQVIPIALQTLVWAWHVYTNNRDQRTVAIIHWEPHSTDAVWRDPRGAGDETILGTANSHDNPVSNNLVVKRAIATVLCEGVESRDKASTGSPSSCLRILNLASTGSPSSCLRILNLASTGSPSSCLRILNLARSKITFRLFVNSLKSLKSCPWKLFKSFSLKSPGQVHVDTYVTWLTWWIYK